MCEDDRTAEHTDERAGGLTRRRFLSGVAGAAGVVTTGAILNRFPERLALASPLRASDAVGGTAYSMAMHIHSSFSEQNGSMDGHLHQAATNAVDVCWWTDHDHRMEALSYRDVTHFTSFSERGAAGQGGAWDWTVQESGPNTSASSSAIVQNPCSPNDPVAGGALRLTAQSRSTALAAYGLLADCHPAGWNYRDNLSGQTLLIDVLLADGWSRGHLELLIATSFHPAVNGAPGGNYTLSYRFAPGGQASRVASGTAGVVTVPMTAGPGIPRR